ncbi:hypothetical protein JQ621_10520 [Bradyrhizobium manausense]|uniref:hypothetical protein n=1 Tax=Bradyrhizobium manausense TaxID=989370 RepID=UPI001BA4F7B6|nr:hypothetical protein [Bradyrhizobium manausense]MBR1087894.1 hypothetical protein [Bradyrhizobium manausense]
MRRDEVASDVLLATQPTKEFVSTPLDLAGDRKLSDALRRCEHAFNEDVLPPRTRLEEPREFYAAIHLGCMPHGRDQASRRQVALGKTSALLPDVAA